MRPLHEGLEWKSFPTPNEVGTYVLCADCGKLAEEFCKTEVRGDRTIKVPLYWQDAPKDKCDCHIEVEICEATGKICNSYCALVPGNTVKKVSMLIFDEDWKVKKEEDYVYNPEK